MNKIKGKVKIRNWKKKDIPKLVEIYQKIYSNVITSTLDEDRRLFTFNLNNFPEGQILAEIDGEIVAYACSIIVQLDEASETYTYNEITGEGSFSTHNPTGDTLYGADIGVLPDFRGQGLAGRLYVHRKKLLRKYNLKRMIAHGRIPGYSEVAGQYSPEEYIEEVRQGNLRDSILSTHFKTGYKVKKVILDNWGDDKSLNYSTYLEYENDKYDEVQRKLSASSVKRPTRRVRVCATQYEMRNIRSWAEFENGARFYIETACNYNTHFVVFPELFTIQLFSSFEEGMDDLAAIDHLTTFLDQYIDFFTQQAVENNIYIVAGTHPTKRDGKIYNTAYLFTPSGKHFEQDKLHITPAERTYFGITPGTGLNVFDTPFAKIAIVICYDIEFPELSRLLVNQGVEVIIVPFSTDEKKSYNRIRFTAHARAVENYAYVVLSGNVGNLHNVKSYLINYAQSAILTPSDFGFPNGSVEGEADPNTETVVIADLDITNLLLSRETGTVRPFFDKRHDLYELTAKVPIKHVKCE